MSKNFFEITNATFKVGGTNKVNNVSFSIENEGDIICLLGPSGIGKTTILRSIAGLEKIDSGEIKLKGKTISSNKINIEPEDRNISLSFQENSLFPHYTVKENIYLGKERKVQTKKKKININKIIKLLNIGKILDHYPHQISAGEAQRVSLARSIMSKPDLLLLDEPFSNIDQSLKDEIQYSVKNLLKKISLTTILVTHDSFEAFSLADKCGVILNQELKQFDVPYSVHHEPNSLEVAKFLNRGVFVEVEVIETDCAVHSLKHSVLGEIRGKLVNNFPVGSKVKLLLQPVSYTHLTLPTKA